MKIALFISLISVVLATDTVETTETTVQDVSEASELSQLGPMRGAPRGGPRGGRGGLQGRPIRRSCVEACRSVDLPCGERSLCDCRNYTAIQCHMKSKGGCALSLVPCPGKAIASTEYPACGVSLIPCTSGKICYPVGSRGGPQAIGMCIPELPAEPGAGPDLAGAKGPGGKDPDSGAFGPVIISSH